MTFQGDSCDSVTVTPAREHFSVFELTNIRLPPIPDLSLITTEPDTYKKKFSNQIEKSGRQETPLSDRCRSAVAGSSDSEGPLWKAALTAKKINRKKIKCIIFVYILGTTV